MTNSYMTEEYQLPSLGKVYSEKVNPVVKLKSMTTVHEMKRLSPSERRYKNLCEIIDDCLVENPGISSYDMCMADYTYLLQKLRVVTYGNEYKVMSTCPFCGIEREKTINLDELQVDYYDVNNFAELSEFILPKTNKRIKLIMQTPRMNDDVTIKAKEAQRRTKGQGGDSAFLITLESIISTIDGNKPDIIQLEDFIRNLPMMDTNYITQHQKKLVESFGLTNSIECTCPVCGLDYTSSFRYGSDFFRPEIDL